jgi:hypothetical protein
MLDHLPDQKYIENCFALSLLALSASIAFLGTGKAIAQTLVKPLTEPWG